MTIKGTSGNDNLTGTSGDDIFDLTQGGNDTVNGLAGDDTFKMGNTLTAADKITGGGGDDMVTLGGGSYAAGITLGVHSLVSIETLKFFAGDDYKFTTNDANVAAGAVLTVDGSALGVNDTLAFNGSHELDGSFAFIGGKAGDTLTGGAKADTFDLSLGGSDSAKGGNGNDTFDMGARLNAADAINGGAGNDTVKLDGDYSAGVTFNATTMTGVEKIVLAAGHDYTLTLNSAPVTPGALLTVNAGALDAEHNLVFDGSASSAELIVIAGAGNDIITVGSAPGGNMIKMGAHFTADDQITGGDSIDFVYLAGDTNVTMNNNTVQNIDAIYLGGGHDYNLTLADGNIAAGKTMDFNTSEMQSGDSFTLDASAETDGSIEVLGFTNFGHYVLTGSSGNDFFDLSDGSAGEQATITGGVGGDTIYAAAAEGGTDTFIYTGVNQSTGDFHTHDLLRFVNFGTDKMEVSGFSDTGGVSSNYTGATINHGSFDADLAAAVSGHLAANGACIVLATAGDESNNLYLVLDMNGDHVYTNGQDYVFGMDGSETGSLSASFFN